MDRFRAIGLSRCVTRLDRRLSVGFPDQLSAQRCPSNASTAGALRRRSWRYGFADAFNPTSGWVSKDVVGIAAGITLLSAEHLRTGSVWKWFMSNPEPERALDMVGLVDFRHPLKNYTIDPDKIVDERNYAGH
jgi:hypothetical protein